MIRVIIAAAGALWGASVLAQDAFPTKPVRIILSTATGGASDTMVRLIGERLAPQWKQNVLVENRPGGGAVIATEVIARANPDGHTLGLLGSTVATNPAVRTDLRYDTQRDLRALLYCGTAPAVLTTRADFPAHNVAEFFALVKAAPDKYLYGSAGMSTNGHRSMEALKRAVGFDIRHVPYKGVVGAVTDLLGGQIPILMAAPTAFKQHIKSGRLRALAVTSAKRFQTLPDVPTLAESGVAGFDHAEWWMFVVPARVPEAIEARLHKDIAAIVAQADFKQRMLEYDVETFVTTREASREHLRRQLARWARDAKALGVTP